MIDPLFFTLFATGLTVGFGHCIGMCGPIVASFTLNLRAVQSPFIYYPTGLLLGFLPCGSIYMALFIAARAGMDSSSPREGFFMGVGMMFFFGIGTVPALFLVAKLSDLSWLKSREIIYKIGSVLMIIVGIYFVIKGMRF